MSRPARAGQAVAEEEKQVAGLQLDLEGRGLRVREDPQRQPAALQHLGSAVRPDQDRPRMARAPEYDPQSDRPSGQGLWVVNQLCDLVELRTEPAGTVVRMRVHL